VSRLPELVDKVDAFFARVQTRHGDDMRCGSGCSDCCHVRLSVTHVEADVIRRHVADHPLVPNARLDRCAALAEDGRCQIYPARPLVCRSHGAPIRLAGGVESCFRNFQHTEPDPDCVVDQTTLSALLLAVDRDAGGTGERIDLGELLAALATC
jgi:uncharacterized protein